MRARLRPTLRRSRRFASECDLVSAGSEGMSGKGDAVMRKSLVSLVLAVVPVVLCGQDAGSGPTCAHGKAQFAALFNDQDPAGPPLVDDFSTDTDVLHYQLDLEIRPTDHWLGGSNTMRVRSLVDN